MDKDSKQKKQKFLKKKDENIKNLIKKHKQLLKLKKQAISNDTIRLFYDEPTNFFEKHETLLNNTSYYDETNNSIFDHYFYILYNIFINKHYKNSGIYSSNFKF